MKHPQALREKLCAAVSVARRPYAWPGGYPRILVMRDGEVLCPSCVKEHLRIIIDATRTGDRDGWAAECAGVNWEDTLLECAHCGRRIESAYGES